MASFSFAFLLLLLLQPIVVRETAAQQSGSNSVGGDWNYNLTSEHGPEHWYLDFPYCGEQSQSPVDIATVQASYDAALVDFSYNGYTNDLPTHFDIKNTGSSVQVLGNWKSTIVGGGLVDNYELSQIHFHWGEDSQTGSEHLLDGKAYPLEIHLVHFNQKYGSFDDSLNSTDGLAVLGVFAQVSTSNDFWAFGNMTAYFDEIPHPDNITAVPSFDLMSLLPEQKTYYRYPGSLTTPECQQSVIWTVFHHPILVNEQEIAAFRSIYDSHGEPLLHNYRPVQPLNGRVVLTSIFTSAAATPHQSVAMAALLTALSIVMATVRRDWIS